MTDKIVDFANARIQRLPEAKITYPAVLRGIAKGIEQYCAGREEQIAAFGEQLTIDIDLEAGNIRIHPEPRFPDDAA